MLDSIKSPKDFLRLIITFGSFLPTLLLKYVGLILLGFIALLGSGGGSASTNSGSQNNSEDTSVRESNFRRECLDRENERLEVEIRAKQNRARNESLGHPTWRVKYMPNIQGAGICEQIISAPSQSMAVAICKANPAVKFVQSCREIF